MHFRIELNNTGGDITNDFTSVIFSRIYQCFLGFWVFTCLKNQAYVHKIHILMGALIATVTLDLIFGPADSQCAKLTSTGIVFYTFKFMRVVLFYNMIVLMCAGWSFLRPIIQVKEMMILTIVILINVASILVRETNPFHIDRRTWWGWFFVVDNIGLCSFVITALGTGKWIDEVCKVDDGGKVARNFAKIVQVTWVDDAPSLGLVYINFWRYAIFCVKTLPNRKYSQQVARYSHELANVTEEIFYLVFCMVLFYMFRPAVENQYCFLDVQDEVEVEVEVTQWALGPARNRCKRRRIDLGQAIMLHHPSQINTLSLCE